MNFSLTSQLIGAAGSNVDYGETFSFLWESTGFANLQWGNVVMILIAAVFLFLAIKCKFEPLLLVGIAFGMLLSNLPAAASDWIFHPEWWTVQDVDYINVLQHGGLIDILYIGVKTSVYPCLIFLGVGAMTDFEPLLSNPKSLILGAAAQLGIYVAFFLAVCFGFTGPEAASIGIVGGADGPTAIWLAKALAPHMLAAIAIAAYSYMALIPVIQPPLMRLMTTKKERAIVMKPTRKVTKAEKILFPIIIIIATCLFLPSVAPLLGCLMLGNLLHRAERAHEHRHHLPFRVRRRDGALQHLPQDRDFAHHRAGAHGIHVRDRGRPALRQTAVLALQRQDQSSHRLGGRLRGAHGGASVQLGRAPSKTRELPSHARDGSQRRGRHRFGSRRRLPYGSVRRRSGLIDVAYGHTSHKARQATALLFP